MKGNEGPKGQKLENGGGHGAAKPIVRTLGQRTVFGNLWGGGGGPQASHQRAKMPGNECPQGQNERK